MNVHHYSIEVTDLEKSVLFYERALGFTQESRMLLNGEQIAFLKLGPARLELVQPAGSPPVAAVPSNMHIAFEVAELGGVCERLLNEGCIMTEGPIKLDNGWSCIYMAGPDGEPLEFIQTG